MTDSLSIYCVVQWDSESCLAHEIRDVAAKDRVKINAGENKMEVEQNLGSPALSTIPRAGEGAGKTGLLSHMNPSWAHGKEIRRRLGPILLRE